MSEAYEMQVATVEEAHGAEVMVNVLAIQHNVKVFKDMDAKLMAVIKNNGYGMGLVEYARILLRAGADALAVGSYAEAMELRSRGVDEELLLLTPILSVAHLKKLIERKVTLVLGGVRQMECVLEAAALCHQRPRVHVAVDTGLGRYGFSPDELHRFISRATEFDIEGTYTHFAAPYQDEVLTRKQFKLFKQCVNVLKNKGVSTGRLHCCASGAALRFPEMRMDMIRIGSGLVGGVPEFYKYGLKKAWKLRAPVLRIRWVKAGERPGYGARTLLRRRTRVAVIAAGYADGIFMERTDQHIFRLAPVSWIRYTAKTLLYGLTVWINDEPAKVIGSVGANYFMVEADKLEIKEGDMVELKSNPILLSQHLKRDYRFY